jgi:amino acid adenylation domain-containing protein
MVKKTAESFQTSPQQEALWLAEPDGPSARTQAVLQLHGPLDEAAMQEALRQAVRRHEILRTTFAREPGFRIPLQMVADRMEPEWTTIDVTALEADQQAAQLSELLATELAAPLHFAAGPLLRAGLVTFASDRHTLVLTLSGLCADSSSAALLARELIDHYGALGRLVEDPLQYADFAAWQRELAASEDDERRSAAEFWNSHEEISAPTLPFVHSATGPFTPGEVEVPLVPELISSLTALAARYGSSVAAIVQAAWQVLLGRLSGDESVVVAYVGSERRHADLEGAIGAFARPVPVAARVGPLVTFAEVLQDVQRGREQASVWQDYAPVGAAAKLAIGFVAHETVNAGAGGLTATLQRVAISGHGLRLWLTCAAGAEHLQLRIAFDPSYLGLESAQRIARRLGRVLVSVAADAGAPVGELELLDDAERHDVLEAFNDTAAAAPDACVHELFAALAVAEPSRQAVVDEHRALTYAELEAQANQLAHMLRRAGVGPDIAVGLCTDRSVEMVVGLLGILKAGGAYVPLHYEHPKARLLHQLDMAGARAIVTQEALLERLPDFGGEVVCLDRDRETLGAEPSTPPDVRVSHQNLVYVIYTSGSTGTPKGVGVTHGNLAAYASFIGRRLGADAQVLSFGVVTSISTDLGNTSVYGALCSGGTLVLVSPAAAADSRALARELQTTPIDVLKITPSHAGALLAGGEEGVLPRQWLVLGGERAPWDLVSRVRERAPELQILNHYGPTEATVGCCTFAVTDGPGEYEPATVPIGRPIANTACYVLDDRLRPVPIGVRGRLFVSGSGVARGYVGQPELTAERFQSDPFSPERRMYDTGDLVRWLPDGALEFLGRVDEQIKIRGYRIEPAEIETALRSHPQVGEAVVVAREGAAGDPRLIAYCGAEGAVSQDHLRRHLADWLPEFMLPSAIVLLDSLPRTPSGKVDVLALPDPDTEQVANYVPPRTPMEEAVARIWSRVLGIEQVGVEDDFFALGGHSLLATQVVAQIRSDFAVELPLHSLFTYPTVASLTAEVVRMMGESDADETATLLAELEGLSDEEAERLLAAEDSG